MPQSHRNRPITLFNFLLCFLLFPAPFFAVNLDIPTLEFNGLNMRITWTEGFDDPIFIDIYFMGWIQFPLTKNIRTSALGANISYFDFAQEMPGGNVRTNTTSCRLEAFDASRTLELAGVSRAFTEILVSPLPTFTVTPSITIPPPTPHHIPRNAIIGGALGGFAFFALIVGACFLLFCRHRRHRVAGSFHRFHVQSPTIDPLPNDETYQRPETKNGM